MSVKTNLKEFEGGGEMMVLEDSVVVVKDGQLVARVGEELVVEAGVIYVVYSTGKQCCKHLQVSENLLKWEHIKVEKLGLGWQTKQTDVHMQLR